MPFLADNSFIAIKKETTAGVAVVPTVHLPLVSESIKTVMNLQADRRMKALSWKSDQLLRNGNRQHTGDIVLLGDPDTLGHVLNMLMVKGSDSGSSAYTHPFTVGTGKTYTFEIKKGNYAQRYFGVTIDKLKIEFKDGAMLLTLTVAAMGQVSIMQLGTALSGSVTSLNLDDEYDIAPNTGLVVGDVINVGGTDVTLTSVDAAGVAVGFASTSLTFSAGAAIYLKAQTASLSTLQDPFYLGNVRAGFGADAAAAATAAGAVSTATPLFDLTLTFNNNLFSKNGSNRFDPVSLKPQTQDCLIACKQLFETVAQRQAFLDRNKQALVIVILGKFIAADFSTQEKLTLTFNKVKLTDNPHALTVGELIMDDQTYEALYDNSDAQAMAASLINRTATY